MNPDDPKDIQRDIKRAKQLLKAKSGRLDD
jgi:hypothetical protein